ASVKLATLAWGIRYMCTLEMAQQFLDDLYTQPGVGVGVPRPSVHLWAKVEGQRRFGFARPNTGAHAYSGSRDRHRGWICVIPKELDQPEAGLAWTMAHEFT